MDDLPRFDSPASVFDGGAGPTSFSRWSPSDNALLAGLLLRTSLVFQGAIVPPPPPGGLAAGVPPALPASASEPALDTTRWPSE